MSENSHPEAAKKNGETWAEATERLGLGFSPKEFKERGLFITIRLKKGGSFTGTLVEINSILITLRDAAGLFKTFDPNDIRRKKSGEIMISVSDTVSEKEQKKAAKKKQRALEPTKTQQRIKKVTDFFTPKTPTVDWNDVKAANDEEAAENGWAA